LNEKILEEIDAAYQEADTWGFENAEQQKIFYRYLKNSLTQVLNL